MLSYPKSVRINYIFTIFLIIAAIVITGIDILINTTNTLGIAYDNNISNNGDLKENQSMYIKQHQHNLRIPNNISVFPELLGEGNLALSAISYNNTIEHTRNLDDELLPFQLKKWHQFIKFIPNFDHRTQDHDLTISNLLIGRIGNFDGFDDLLKEARLYQGIPINSTVVVELPNDSVSFMLAEVKSSNQGSAIYYGLYDGNTYDDKSEINPKLESIVLETINPLSIKADYALYNVTQALVCHDISKHGYQQCS